MGGPSHSGSRSPSGSQFTLMSVFLQASVCSVLAFSLRYPARTMRPLKNGTHCSEFEGSTNLGALGGCGSRSDSRDVAESGEDHLKADPGASKMPQAKDLARGPSSLLARHCRREHGPSRPAPTLSKPSLRQTDSAPQCYWEASPKAEHGSGCSAAVPS